jgi:ectoine hydroxylase-related dioxygenase (phytanoyl-CoA dioxygenase family)
VEASVREHWGRHGYLVLPGATDPALVVELRRICETILEAWRRRDPQTTRPGRTALPVCMRHLNHPAYFERAQDDFATLMRTIALPSILGVAREILGEAPMFRCTSLFFNPIGESFEGEWHRDVQYEESDEAMQRKIILESGGSGRAVQIQIALVPSADVEIVPGSHLRWDTADEYAIRLGEGGRNNRSALMPGAKRIALAPGDVAVFNPNAVHRGRYHEDKPRRTLMLTYLASSQTHCDWFSHQPWFLDDSYLARIPSEARPFFEAFEERYRGFWLREA